MQYPGVRKAGKVTSTRQRRGAQRGLLDMDRASRQELGTLLEGCSL